MHNFLQNKPFLVCNWFEAKLQQPSLLVLVNCEEAGHTGPPQAPAKKLVCVLNGGLKRCHSRQFSLFFHCFLSWCRKLCKLSCDYECLYLLRLNLASVLYILHCPQHKSDIFSILSDLEEITIFDLCFFRLLLLSLKLCCKGLLTFTLHHLPFCS